MGKVIINFNITAEVIVDDITQETFTSTIPMVVTADDTDAVSIDISKGVTTAYNAIRDTLYKEENQ